MKKKVTLVFCKNYLVNPTHKDTMSVKVEVDTPSEFEDTDIHLIAARTYPEADNSTSMGGIPGGETINSVVLGYDEVQRDLLGKLLTYIDATYSDSEQRQAHKDLVRQALGDWHERLRERAAQTIDSHKKVKFPH